MNTKVSIIIPTYNRANLLAKAIKSVLNQTYKDLELIIVDDGSEDNTREVVKHFQVNDLRVQYIYQENRGLSSALNKGLSIASGEYIAFLESDDEWLPRKLEKQLKVFTKHLSVGLVTCWSFRIFENGNKKKLFKTHKGIIKKENWCNFFKTKGIISPSTIILRREVFDSVGNFDTKLKAAVDLDFYIRLIKNFDIYFLPIPLVNYYESQESLSKKNFWIKWIPDLEYLFQKHQDSVSRCIHLKFYFLKTLGTCYLLDRDYNKARKYFLESIKIKPLKLRTYLQYLLTFFPKFYKSLLFLKRKLF